MNPLLIPAFLMLTACTSLDYKEGADGSVSLSYVSTREVTALSAQKNAEGVSVDVGRASGVEGIAEVVADKIMDRIPSTIGVELQ